MMQQQILQKATLKIATSEGERDAVIALLRKLNLPTSDINDDIQLHLLRDGENIIGTAGLEIFGDCALLRSVSVATEQQGKGYGKIINEQIQMYAKESGIECLYLITTSAKAFFDQLGFRVIERNVAPESVKQTAEFSSLCPSSAVVMKKLI